MYGYLASYDSLRNKLNTLTQPPKECNSNHLCQAAVWRDYFSIAGKVFRPERCRLCNGKFLEVMGIKSNAI